MSVCTTCLQPGIPVTGHDCPGIGEIQLTRQLGRGLIVTSAPARARMNLALLNMPSYGAGVVNAGQINIADQVLYQVVGYDPDTASLVLELVEDWRTVLDEHQEQPMPTTDTIKIVYGAQAALIPQAGETWHPSDDPDDNVTITAVNGSRVFWEAPADIDRQRHSSRREAGDVHEFIKWFFPARAKEQP